MGRGDIVIKASGTVTKVTGSDIGIYISRSEQEKLRGFVGRKVTVIIIVEGKENG